MKTPVSTLNRASGNEPYQKEQGTTPIPRKCWFAVFFMVASAFFSGNVIIPFVPFLVARLFPGLNKTELGTRTGFLDGAFYVGIMFGGPIWGRLSDIVGRKVALLWGVFSGIGLAVAFGFCDNYILALVIRLVWGMSGANISISRAVLAEASDHTNRARMFTALGLGNILGRLLGNGIGGLLAEPADKYSCLNIEFFRQYPYSLPVFISAVLNLVSLVIGVLYLPETKPRLKIPTGGPLLKSPIQPGHKPGHKQPSFCDVLKRGKSSVLFSSCFFIALCHAIYNVVFPLWVLNKKQDHGFELGSSGIGMTRVLAVPTDLILQLLLFPYAVKMFGIFRCYQFCSLLWAAAVIVTPNASLVNRSPKTVQWVILELCVVMNNILCAVTLSSNGILCTNSTDSQIRGTFMGVRQSFIGLGRGLGASFGGILFSWSLQYRKRTGVVGQFPFDFFFTWFIQAYLMSIVFTLSWFLGGKDLERTPEEWRDYNRRQSLRGRTALRRNIMQSGSAGA